MSTWTNALPSSFSALAIAQGGRTMSAAGRTVRRPTLWETCCGAHYVGLDYFSGVQ